MHSLLTRWRRTAALASTVVVAAAALSAVPATPAHAQAQQSCLTATISANTWSTGSGGGFVLNIAITNGCQAPVSGWTLRFTLPPDHTAHSGWSAKWTIWERQVTATGDGWSAVIPAGGSINIGLIGTNAGTFQDPQGCTINGFPCDGAGGNQPPEVALTSPEEGFGTPITCPVPLAAEATDPDGAIDRVEFYVNDQLLAIDDTAPYEAEAFGPGGPLVLGENTAFARAYDDGGPALSTDSEPVTFTMLPPPPSSPGDCDSPLPPIPPEVTLTSPTGEVLLSPCPVRFAANAIDLDGTVQLVEFYVDDTLVGSDDQAPYEVTVPGNHPALSGGTNHTAYARAYDDQEPPLSGFSQQVEFSRAPPPPALMIIACDRPGQLTPGSSHVVHFQSVCGTPEVDVAVTVTGDPGITADPTSFTLGPDGQDVTISAAPDSAGATATVRAEAEGCLPAAVEVTVSGNHPPQVALTSPSAGGGIVATCPVRLVAEATDPDGGVARVDFFVNDQLVASDTEAPYQAQIPGSHASLEVAGQPNAAVAEVVDDGDPALSGVSQEVSFTQLFPPPGLAIIACTNSVELAAGGSQVVDLQQGCGQPEVAIEMVVDGDPGITVDPGSFVLGSGEQAVTISAAPGTEGATASVRAQADDCLPGTVQVTVAG